MSGGYDVIVIGAGHNGLSCAALLARTRRRVLVVERREIVGGLAASEEFWPGYRHAGVLPDTTRVTPQALAALDLVNHGLALRTLPQCTWLPMNGRGLWWPDGAEQAVVGVDGVEQRARFMRFVDSVRPALVALATSAPPRLAASSIGDWLHLASTGWGIRRLGAQVMHELLRVIPMSAADWLGEHFEDEGLKALLCAPAIYDTWLGPRSAGSAFTLLLREAVRGPGVKGGPVELIGTLVRAALAADVELRLDCAVTGLRTADRVVQGVELADGSFVPAPLVVASCDPKHTLLELLPQQDLEDAARARMAAWRTRGSSGRVHLALRGALGFDGAGATPVEQACIGATLDDFERACDALKYRRMPERPVLEVHVPTVARPDLAPPGHHVVTLGVHFVTADLDGGWSAERRSALGDLAVETLARYAPAVRELEVGREVLTPQDLQQRYGVSGGQVHHGEHALDQLLVRPTPECAQYSTPVRGLYLCGSGCHPGGGLTCLPGILAARAVLRRA